MTEETVKTLVKSLREEASLEMNRYYISRGDSADRAFLKSEIYSKLVDILEAL